MLRGSLPINGASVTCKDERCSLNKSGYSNNNKYNNNNNNDDDDD